jgi:hypothetical protein
MGTTTSTTRYRLGHDWYIIPSTGDITVEGPAAQTLMTFHGYHTLTPRLRVTIQPCSSSSSSSSAKAIDKSRPYTCIDMNMTRSNGHGGNGASLIHITLPVHVPVASSSPIITAAATVSDAAKETKRNSSPFVLSPSSLHVYLLFVVVPKSMIASKPTYHCSVANNYPQHSSCNEWQIMVSGWTHDEFHRESTVRQPLTRTQAKHSPSILQLYDGSYIRVTKSPESK